MSDAPDQPAPTADDRAGPVPDEAEALQRRLVDTIQAYEVDPPAPERVREDG